MRDFYVYALLDVRKPGSYSYAGYAFEYEPFYIGKGCRDRYNAHFMFCERYGLQVPSSRNLHKVRRIWSIFRESGNPPRIVIKSGLSETAAFALERLLVRTIGRRDLNTGPLTNLTSGGEGVSGRIFTTRERAALARRLVERLDAMSDQEYACFNASVSRGLQRWYQEATPEQLADRAAALSEGLHRRSAKDVETWKRRIRRSNRSYWNGLTKEQKQEHGEIRARGSRKISREVKLRNDASRRDKSRRMWSTMTPAEEARLKRMWSRRRRRAWRERTPEQRREIGEQIRTTIRNRTPEEKRETSRKLKEAWAKISPEKRAAMTKKRLATLRRNQEKKAK